MFDSEKFKDMVSTVAAEETESDQAHLDRLEAEAELFGAVLQKARPALRAIGTRPVIRYHVAHHADSSYNGGIHTRERYEFRCVPLSSNDFGPAEDCPKANNHTAAKPKEDKV